jgi:DNA polymerase V
MNTNPLPNAYTTRENEMLPKITAIAGGRIEEEHTDSGFDLNEQLVRNKPATFFMRVNSDAMTGAGIHNGDVIIVDRSLPAKSGKIVVAVLNGEMLVRRYERAFNKIRLVPETPKLAAIDVDPFSEFLVWGVVTYVIHEV